MKKPLRPYIFKAYYNYFVDNGEKVYIEVNAPYIGASFEKEFKTFIVPESKTICFNISPDALGRLDISDDGIDFTARFNGEVKDVYVPMGAINGLLNPSSSLYIGLPDDPFYHQSENIRKKNDKKNPELKLVNDEDSTNDGDETREKSSRAKSRKRSAGSDAFKLL